MDTAPNKVSPADSLKPPLLRGQVIYDEDVAQVLRSESIYPTDKGVRESHSSIVTLRNRCYEALAGEEGSYFFRESPFHGEIRADRGPSYEVSVSDEGGYFSKKNPFHGEIRAGIGRYRVRSLWVA